MKFIEKLLDLTGNTRAQLETVDVNSIHLVAELCLGEKHIEMLAQLVYRLIDIDDDETAKALRFCMTFPVIVPVDSLSTDAEQLREWAKQIKNDDLFFDLLDKSELIYCDRMINLDDHELPSTTETGVKVKQAIGQFCVDTDCYELEFDLMQRGREMLNENTVDDAQLIRQEIIKKINLAFNEL